MFTLLRIHFYPFSYRSVLPVHTAPDTFENGMKTMKRSHCSAMDEKGKRYELVNSPCHC